MGKRMDQLRTGQRILVEVEVETLPDLIYASAHVCLSAHGIQFSENGRVLPDDETAVRLRELGNNVAQAIVMREVKPCPMCGAIDPQDHDHQKHGLPAVGGRL